MRCVVVPSSLFIRKSGPYVHQEMDPGVCGVEQERWFSCSCSQGETNSGLQAPSLWPGLLRGFSSRAWIWSVTPFFLCHPLRGWCREPCTVSVSWLALGNGSILKAHTVVGVHGFTCFFPCLRGSGMRGPREKEENCPGAGSVHSTTTLRALVLSSLPALLCPLLPRGIHPLCGSMAFRCLQMATLIFNPCLCFHLSTRIFAPLTSQIHTE